MGFFFCQKRQVARFFAKSFCQKFLACGTLAGMKTPTPPATLPRGVSLVQWQNQDGTKVTRYRVRVKNKTQTLNKLAETWAEVCDLLNIVENNEEKQLDKKTSEKVFSLIFSNLETELKKYLLRKYKLEDIEESKNLADIERRQFKAELSRIKTISQTNIFYNEKLEKFGNLNHWKLKRIHFLAYCEARDKSTIAQETIKREISLIRGYFKYLLNSSRGANAYEHNILNGFSYRFNYAYERKEKERITEKQEEALFEALKNNRKMLDIVALALLTGMRKSEVLNLKQEQINEGIIYLDKKDTKTRRSRTVFLNEDAQNILNNYKQPGRIFTYTIDGFNANMKRALSKAGLSKVINLHHLRMEFVSRVMSLDYFNDIQKQQLAGLSSFGYFKKTFLDKQKKTRPETPEDVAKNNGQSLEVMSLLYSKVKRKK